MKKIWIDISFTLKNKTGVGGYVLTLLNAFDSLNLNYEKISCDFLENKSFKAIPYFLWLNTVFFIKTLIEKPDIIISPSFMMPYFKRKKTKYLTTIHDLTPYLPETMSKYSVLINKFAIVNAVNRADKILTVSETVKQELIKKFLLPENRIIVTYNSINSIFYNNNTDSNDKILQKNNLIEKKYLLSVATLNKRKNLISLIKGFEKISDNNKDLKLVLVGDIGNQNSKNLTDNKNIIFTGYISDSELVSLYKNALVYVFPSIYEGFGIPVLEAQFSKVAVICSNIEVFREVAGDSVLFFEPNPDSIAESIETLVNNVELRKLLIAKGLENVKRFNSTVISKQLKSVLD